MRKQFTPIFVALFFSVLYGQEVTDISPDGALSNTYIYAPNNSYSPSAYQDVPFHSSPSWSAMRERQIGGLAFGDYDGDGDLDLAVGCYFSNSYPPINDYENFIFKNNNGVLDTLPAWITSDEKTTTDLRWADVNMDGRPDLLSANGQFQHSTLYLNSDSGLSTTPAWTSNDNVWTVGAAFNDIDGDGDLDLALGNQGLDPNPYKPIQVFDNINGTLSVNPTWSSGDIMITNSVAFADINNSDLTQHNVTYTASGSGYSFLLPFTPVYKIDQVMVNFTATDNYSYDPLNCWLALGFIPPSGVQVDITYTYIKHGDMAAAKWVAFESGIYYNNVTALNAFPGWTVGHDETQKGIAWADIDLDGYMDLAVGGSSMPNQIFKNNNGIISSTPYWQSSGSNTSVQDLIWGDVNRDGYPDLAVIHFGYRRTDIFINRGGILDTAPTWSYTASSSATTLAFGDVNGDGWLDLAIGTARQPVMLFIADPALVPVELTSFTAVKEGNEIFLNWITATEKNNYGFEIERKVIQGIASADWEKIGFVKGMGTHSSVSSYSFKDKPENNGRYIYRLKQIDYDGSFTFSRTAEVNLFLNYSFQLEQNYPNPFNPETKIRYTIPQGAAGNSTPVILKISDVLGREVAVLVNEEKAAGTYELNFNAGEFGLSSGAYLYSLKSGDISITRKFILMK